MGFLAGANGVMASNVSTVVVCNRRLPAFPDPFSWGTQPPQQIDSALLQFIY